MTVQSLARALQLRFPDASDDRAIAAAIRAHEDVTLACPRAEMASTDVSVSVTASTSEYTLSGLDAVDDARFGGKALTYKTVEQLRTDEPNWRATAAAAPVSYYVIGGNTNGELRIGLYPKPSTSGTLSVWGPSARTPAWTTSNWSTEVIPSLPGSGPVYLAVASWHLATQLRPEMVQFYAEGRRDALMAAKEQYRSVGGRNTERVRNG